MAKSNAERQKAYRQNRQTANNGDSDYRLNTWITSQASFALSRLAKHQNTTQRAILEALILAADEAITKDMDIASEQWKTYHVTQ